MWSCTVTSPRDHLVEYQKLRCIFRFHWKDTDTQERCNKRTACTLRKWFEHAGASFCTSVSSEPCTKKPGLKHSLLYASSCSRYDDTAISMSVVVGWLEHIHGQHRICNRKGVSDIVNGLAVLQAPHRDATVRHIARRVAPHSDAIIFMHIARRVFELADKGLSPCWDTKPMVIWSPREYNTVANHMVNAARDNRFESRLWEY